MAEEEEIEMPITSMKPEKEWSTREKLAIASYVLRSGEQNWSGAGRFLRPLGEPGRPADWFSPKFCAQQYTALMEQLEAPKRKRSERSESSENIQPSSSPEEIIIARLTKERIEELKKQVRCERAEHRKLKRDIELLESGTLDDQLDKMIKEIENGGNRENGADIGIDEKSKKDVIKVENIVDNVEQLVEQPAVEPPPQAMEHEQPTDKVPQSSSEEPLNIKAVDVISEISNENIEKMDTTSATNDDKPTGTESINTASSPEGEPAPPVMVDMPKEEKEECDNVKLEVAEEDSSQHMELPTNEVIEPQVEVKRENTKMKTQPPKREAEPMAIDEPEEEQPKQVKTEKPEIVPVPEADTSSNCSAAVEDEVKQSVSLPGTPAPSGSFPFDSFPSSPALSHSSDMDPDAAANWKAWKKSIMILWKLIASHRLANIFLTPVTDEIAPNYSTTVYRKMDLIMIKKNIEGGVIRTTSEFQRDIMLMFQNAVMYNNVEHDVYKMATEMQKDVVDQIAEYLTTQMIVESSALPPENKSLRRSTIRRSALSDKVGQTRSRRSAVADGDSKLTR